MVVLETSSSSIAWWNSLPFSRTVTGSGFVRKSLCSICCLGYQTISQTRGRKQSEVGKWSGLHSSHLNNDRRPTNGKVQR